MRKVYADKEGKIKKVSDDKSLRCPMKYCGEMGKDNKCSYDCAWLAVEKKGSNETLLCGNKVIGSLSKEK